MSTYPRITLKPGKDSSVLRQHPWIFSGAVMRMDNGIANGDVAEVYSAQGQYLATGHYQAGSIVLRVLSNKPVTVNEHFWLKKLGNALTYRKNLGFVNNKNTNAFRLINAEGDGLPGLVIDLYNNTAVLQPHSAGMEQAKHVIAKVLIELLGNDLKAIYCKNPERENINDGFLFGDNKEGTILENGHTFYVNWEEGQKTGFFLDQRENRHLLAQYCKNRNVLNAFCYSGGFSVYALTAGASEVYSVDSSKKAIEWTEKNVALNSGYTGTHLAIAGDTSDFLKNDTRAYDLLILDPPAFAKHLSARHKAVQGYKRLNALGLSKITPGGILFTFSCSQAIDADLFYNTIYSSAIEVSRNIRVMHRLSQPPDHATSIFHPEGSYLKGLVLYVE